MSTYDWPDTRAFLPARAELRVIDNLQRFTESLLSGYVQTLAMPGARWGWSMDFPAQRIDQRMLLEGFLHSLNGMQHRVRLWDLKHPRPRGTVALSGVTAYTTAAQFATQVTMIGSPDGTTLLAGDFFSVPSGQLLRCVADATFNFSTAALVEIWPPLRAAVPATSAITLDKPTALFVRSEAGVAVPRGPGNAQDPFSVEFMEVFQ